MIRKAEASDYLTDEALSLKAKGLYGLLLDLPEDYDPTLVNLVGLSKDGASALRAAMEELRQKGYLRTYQLRKGEGGSFGEAVVEMTGK